MMFSHKNQTKIVADKIDTENHLVNCKNITQDRYSLESTIVDVYIDLQTFISLVSRCAWFELEQLIIHKDIDWKNITYSEHTKIVDALYTMSLNKQWNLIYDIINVMDMHYVVFNVNNNYIAGKVLYLSAVDKQWHVCRLLAKLKANLNYYVTYGECAYATALWFAAGYNELETFDHLLRVGANLNCCPKFGIHAGKTPEWFVASNKQWHQLEWLITFKQVNINIKPLQGEHAGINIVWLVAAANERWDLVLKLINNNADFNAIAAYGLMRDKTVLWFAAYFNNWEMVKFLLAKGADYQIVISDGIDQGTSVLFFSLLHQQWNIVESILDDITRLCEKKQCIFTLSLCNKQLKLRVSKMLNAEINNQCYAGTSVIWWLCLYKRWDELNKLLDLGLNINFNACAKNGQHMGKSILWLLARESEWPLFKKILPKIAIKDFDSFPENEHDLDAGKTIALFAAYNQEWSVLKLILPDIKSSINSSAKYGDYAGETLLQLTTDFEQKKIIDRQISTNIPKIFQL